MAISFLVGFALFGTLTYLPAYLQVALGLSASGAGLVVTALMAGVLITTVLSGRLITRTGRYKAYPVVGAGVAAAGLALLATWGAGSGPGVITAIMALIGLGVGLIMQVMVLVAQNSVAYGDLGTATSSVAFLRQIGASAGVAVAGALITTRLAEQVAGRRRIKSGDADRVWPDVATARTGVRARRLTAGPSAAHHRLCQGDGMKFVASLPDFGRDDVPSAGGKGANLGELIRAGLPVPDGFVITTAGYAAAIQPLDLRIADRLAADDSASIRADIEALSMPSDLRADIADAYADLGSWSSGGALQRHRRGPAGCGLCRSAGHLPQRHG